MHTLYPVSYTHLPFALPPPHTDMRRVYAYLMKQRHISREVVTHFVRAGLLYEDALSLIHICPLLGERPELAQRYLREVETKWNASYEQPAAVPEVSHGPVLGGLGR